MFDYYFKYGLRYCLRYILKFIIRLFIFFSFIYLISFMTGKDLFISNVSALEVYSYYTGGDIDIINNTQWETFYNLDNHWASWGTGYIRFNFTVQKTPESTPSNTTPLIAPRAAYISTGNAEFICDIGSVNTQNATYNAQIYSAMCPVSFYEGGGLKKIHIYFQDQQYNALGQAKVSFDGHITFEKPNDNFDISGIVNGSNQNTQNIINNQNNNTQSIVDSQQDINNSIKDTNDTIKDDNVDSSTSQGSSFFNDFDSGNFGSLTDIVSLPLDYISHLNDSCTSFVIPAGNLGNITIPCLSSIWSKTAFANVINTASVLINGFICYKLLLNLFYFFKDLKDPDNDKVEVMDL